MEQPVGAVEDFASENDADTAPGKAVADKGAAPRNPFEQAAPGQFLHGGLQRFEIDSEAPGQFGGGGKPVVFSEPPLPDFLLEMIGDPSWKRPGTLMYRMLHASTTFCASCHASIYHDYAPLSKDFGKKFFFSRQMAARWRCRVRALHPSGVRGGWLMQAKVGLHNRFSCTGKRGKRRERM